MGSRTKLGKMLCPKPRGSKVLYDACRKKGTGYRESQLHIVQLSNTTKPQTADLVPDAAEIS